MNNLSDRRSVGSRRRGETRERLLDAGLDLFARQGYAGTPITDIERAVGLTPGTGSFHRHFRSKEALLAAVVDREIGRNMAAIAEQRRELAALGGDGHEQLERSYSATLTDIERFDRLFRLMMTEGDRVPELRTALADALGLADADATWADEPTTLVAVAALAGYHYLSILQGREFEGVERERFVAMVASVASRPPHTR